MNRIKLVVSILACISAISVYPVQKQLTAKQRRLMGMAAARVRKENTAKLEQLLKKDVTTMTPAQYAQWLSNTNEKLTKLKNINPDIIESFTNQINSIKTKELQTSKNQAYKIKRQLLLMNKQITKEKNEKPPNFNLFVPLLNFIDNKKIAIIRDDNQRKKSLAILEKTKKLLANTTHKYVNKKLRETITQINDKITEIHGWSEDKNAPTQDEFKKTVQEISTISKTIATIMSNNSAILDDPYYKKYTNTNIKQTFKETRKKSRKRLKTLTKVWKNYLEMNT